MKLHNNLLPLGFAAAMLIFPAPLAMAQDRAGGGFIDIMTEDVQTPEETPSPAPPPPPSPVLPPRPVKPPPPPPPRDIISYDDHALDAVTRPALTAFASEGEFRRYLGRFERIRRERQWRWVLGDDRRPAHMNAFQDIPAEVPECSDPEQCPNEADTIVMTASRIVRPNVTNVQVAGVDEGDIVKQIGDYLLVLQDGQIFVVDIRTMRRTDRIEVFRRDSDGDPTGADWYDEMLVEGDRVLITAYSYEDSATELSVFHLDRASGRITREGVFLISSDDYYSTTNYATRIIGDKLVMYAPYDLDALADREDRPVIRRWEGPKEREDDQKRGRPLIDAQSLYWPVMRTGKPKVHTVSVCPLGAQAGRRLACETTGFIGPENAVMFVSSEDVFVWTSAMGEAQGWNRGDCSEQVKQVPRPAWGDLAPGVVFRVPVNGDDPSLLAVRGNVFDQFSIDTFRGRFRALIGMVSEKCDRDWDEPIEVALVDRPLAAFDTTYREAVRDTALALPAPRVPKVENRFIDDWLVYGGRTGGNGPPYDDEQAQSAPVIAVPLRDPQHAQVLEPGYEFIRIERVGNDAVLNGYANRAGLHVSLLKLDGSARLAGHLLLGARFESEGRSHAFNALANPDGSGLMGIPTVPDAGDTARQPWRSRQSGISFIGYDATGTLTDRGLLPQRSEEDLKIVHRDYNCEVSCIDWYGNTRPIFTDGRIFGLMATDLVEARLGAQGIEPIANLDLVAVPPGN